MTHRTTPARAAEHLDLRRWTSVAALSLALAGCASASEGSASRPQRSAPEPDPGPLLDAARPAPRFLVRAVDGAVLDSGALVGARPFAVVTFASWCQVCDAKLPLVQRVAARHPGVLLILLSADEAETWPRVSAFVARHRLAGLPLVRATDFPRFASAYAPHATVPTIVVVGREGRPLEYQRGLTEGDEERLELAFSLAARAPSASAARP